MFYRQISEPTNGLLLHPKGIKLKGKFMFHDLGLAAGKRAGQEREIISAPWLWLIDCGIRPETFASGPASLKPTARKNNLRLFSSDFEKFAITISVGATFGKEGWNLPAMNRWESLGGKLFSLKRAGCRRALRAKKLFNRRGVTDFCQKIIANNFLPRNVPLTGFASEKSLRS